MSIKVLTESLALNTGMTQATSKEAIQTIFNEITNQLKGN